MKSLPISDDDFDFLAKRAEALGETLEDLVEQMVLRERVLAKAKPVKVDPRPQNIEPPHRKWGM